MARFRPLRAVGVVAVGLALAGCSSGMLGGSGSAGSCAAPEATATPTSAAPGQTVTVHATYVAPCNDTNMASDPPFGQLDVRWAQNGASTPLTTVRPDAVTGELSVAVVVPADADPGPAVVRIVLPSMYGTVDVPLTVTEQP